MRLPAGVCDAIAAGLADGRTRFVTPLSNLLTGNGWHRFGDDVDNYGPDYALRAYAVRTQFGVGIFGDVGKFVALGAADVGPFPLGCGARMARFWSICRDMARPA